MFYIVYKEGATRPENISIKLRFDNNSRSEGWLLSKDIVWQMLMAVDNYYYGLSRPDVMFTTHERLLRNIMNQVSSMKRAFSECLGI